MSSKRSFDDTQDAKMNYDPRSAARAQVWSSTYEMPKIGMTSTAYSVENHQQQQWQPHQQLQQVQQVQQPINSFIPEDTQRLFW
jgi:hypothetical protein